MAWFSALLDNGYRPEVSHPGPRAGGRSADGLLTLRIDGRAHRWLLERKVTRRPRPSEIGPPPGEQPSALWLTEVTPAMRAALDRHGWSWVSDDGAVVLRSADGQRLVELEAPAGTPDETEDVAEGSESKSPSLSRGALRIVQHLLEWPEAMRQVELAVSVGLTQARVSQLLRRLDGLELTEHMRTGWRLADAGRALDVWLASSAPAAATTTLSWYGLDPLPDQLGHALRRARNAAVGLRVGGDFAADVLAPWRRPARAVLYAERTIDLEPDGFVPAPADSATLLLHVRPLPDSWRPDPRVAAAVSPAGAPWPLAPVSQVIRDVMDEGGPDAAESADRLRSAWLPARLTAVNAPAAMTSTAR